MFVIHWCLRRLLLFAVVYVDVICSCLRRLLCLILRTGEQGQHKNSILNASVSRTCGVKDGRTDR